MMHLLSHVTFCTLLIHFDVIFLHMIHLFPLFFFKQMINISVIDECDFLPMIKFLHDSFIFFIFYFFADD